MIQPIYELIMWNNCNNHCAFCWLKANQEKCAKKFIPLEDTLRPIVLAEKFMDTLCENTPGSSVLFMGGELFDRQLPKKSIKAFMRLNHSCVDRLEDGSLKRVYFNTNLIYKDTRLLLDTLDIYDRYDLLNKVQLTTSYDLGGYRYRSQSDLWLATQNMRMLSHKYPSMIRVANMIMTNICNNVLSLEPFFPRNFLVDTGFSLNLIPYIILNPAHALTRSESMTLLLQMKEYYPDIIEYMVSGLDNSHPKKLLEYDGDSYKILRSRNSSCGHGENFRKVYKDSDECFVCDLIKMQNVE